MKKIIVNSHSLTSLIDITDEIQNAVKKNKWKSGILNVFIPHTTAAVTINENADPNVCEDILYKINKLIPVKDNYKHLEGNSHAHIKASLFGFSEQIIVENGLLKLGTWQGIYFCEFDGPRTRNVFLKFIS